MNAITRLEQPDPQRPALPDWPRLMSIDLAAAYLGLGVSTIRSHGPKPKRWGSRVLDLDLVAWSGGRFRSRGLPIPPPRLGEREFVLGPLATVAPGWKIDGAISARHLRSRLGKRRPSR